MKEKENIIMPGEITFDARTREMYQQPHGVPYKNVEPYSGGPKKPIFNNGIIPVCDIHGRDGFDLAFLEFDKAYLALERRDLNLLNKADRKRRKEIDEKIKIIDNKIEEIVRKNIKFVGPQEKNQKETDERIKNIKNMERAVNYDNPKGLPIDSLII